MASVPAATNPQWRPPQWNQPAVVQLIVPPQNTNANPVQPGPVPLVNNNYQLSTSPGTTQSQTYVFDAVLSLEHSQRLSKTRHPVQSGADISSHAYLEPPSCVLYIGMSDVMQQYATGTNPANVQQNSLIGSSDTKASSASQVTPWSGSNQSKSVNAYQQLLTLQQQRIPLTLVTRLRTYTNVLIVDIAPTEDVRTVTGLRARVIFETIITAAVGSAPVSALPNDTQSTGLGAVNSQSPNPTTLTQYTAPTLTQRIINIPGAGILSSLSGLSGTLQSLTALLPKFPQP